MSILPEQNSDAARLDGESIELDTVVVEPELEELTIVETSTIENTTSTFEIPDSAFGRELKSDRFYTASLTDGEPLPDWITLDPDTGSLTFESEYENIGNHQILVEVQDRFGQAAISLVEVTVTNQAGEDTLLDDHEEPDTFIAVSEGDFGIQETVSIPQIAIADTQITDSSVGRELVFTISLNTPGEQPVTIDYSTADNTANEGEDYIAVNGTVRFEPGETEKTIVVNTTGTSYLDPDEDLQVNLSNPRNATIEDGEGIGTILPAYAGIRGGSRKQEIVTFSFFDEDVFGQGGYDGSYRESNAREPSEVIKANYRQIFDNLNTFVDREFVEVAESESEQGNIRIVVSDGPDYAYAGGHIHLAGWAAASDAGINGWESPLGVYAYSALIHELGHAIGMPHSFGRETSVFDPEESAVNTVMSYTSPGAKPATFMSYDIKSLQERYGAAEYRSEDTVYEFITVDNYLVDGEIALDTNRRLKQTIWDSGGTDTFDFSGLAVDNSGYRFDLNQSQYQTTKTGFTGSSYDRNGTTYYVPHHGTSIAIDVEIENLINSSSDDIIIANPVANTFSGYAPGLTTGDDVFIGTDELDTLDLSEFSFLDIAWIVHESDLKVELGNGNSITVPNYFATPEEERMNVLLDQQSVSFKEVGSAVEGNDGVKSVNMTVQLAQASSDRLEINYTTVDETAQAGLDYVAQTGTVVFEPGETEKNITVEIKGDREIEGSEGFGIDLLGNYGQIMERGYIIIDDDDGSRSSSTITISDATVTSSNNGLKAIFEVRIDEFIDSNPVTVDFSTADNVAVAEQDYVATSGTLAFSIEDGNKVKTIEVDIIGDNPLSRDEDFKLQLSNPSSNATIADDEAIGTILDSTLNINFADGTQTELQLASYPPDGEKDPDNLPFEVDAEHNSLTITGSGNGWKEVPLANNLNSNDSPIEPYTVVEFDFRTTEVGKLHGVHFESKDHHDFYIPWETDRFFQLAGSSEFGIQDFNNYQDSLGEWKTYQIPVGQFIDNTIFHNGNQKAIQWLAFAHEGNSDDANSQFRNLRFLELVPISVAGVAVNESSDVATFTLTIPEASNEVISLDYTTEDDTAVAGEDYTAKSGTVTFAPGETSQTIEITLNDNNESEAVESFNLNLSQVENAIALESQIVATIEDNDAPLPVISVEEVGFDEGNLGTNTVSITFNLNQASNEQITVDYSTEDVTAIAGEDYQAATGQVTFAPGEISKTIELELNSDVLNETDESFLLNLTDAVNATIESDRNTVAINNDDALPNLNIGDAGILASIPVRNNEGRIKNSTGLLFEATLDAPSNQTIKVDYSTVDGTAKAGEDYNAKNKTLTFQPGETVKNIFVNVVLDDTTETDEELSVVLSNAQNATISDNQATGTIEVTRSLSVSDIEISEDGTEAIFTVSLDQPSVQGVFVTYATEDGSAKAGTDYTETKGRLFIKAGETSATVAVPIIDNNITEADETFYLNLSKPKYVLLEDNRGEATIVNDDAIPTENPGGIYQNLQLWLKADAAETDEEKKVIAWKDSSQGTNDLTETFDGTNPTLKQQGINFNPTVEFDERSDRLGNSNITNFPTAEITQFIVLQRQKNSREQAYFSYASADGSNEFLLFDVKEQTEVSINNNSVNVPTSLDNNPVILGVDWQAENGVGHVYNNDNSVEFAGSTRTITPTGTIVIGDDQDNLGGGFQSHQAFVGQIAENIIYDRILTSTERQQVNSYLATKYGTTLETNYLNSDSAIIWNANQAGEYIHDIAGIAIDSGSGLSQLTSRSSNDDAIVTIGNPSDLQDGEALFWSNSDRGNLNDKPDGMASLRIWQVQEQGNVGTVTVSFDLSQLEEVAIEKYALQISDADDFSDFELLIAGRTIENNILSFTGIDFQNGEYFTLNNEYTEPPTEEPPAEEPVTEPPAEEPSSEEPVTEPPTEEPPTEEPPTEPPAEEPPTQEPVTELPTEEPPTEEPVTEPPAEELPVEKPVTEPPVEEPSSELSNLKLIEVDRFYNYTTGYHFYILDEGESIEVSPNDENFNYEEELLSVLDNDINNLAGEIESIKLDEFSNNNTDAHLTMSSTPQDYLLHNLDNYDSLSVAYYAFESEFEYTEIVPVYRLLDEKTATGLSTGNLSVVDYIKNNLGDFNLENNNDAVFDAIKP